jgi:Domain of unknown function (DUF1929)/PKD domain/Bacterial Ig domain
MFFSKLNGSRGGKIPTETCSLIRRAITLSAVTLCALGIVSQMAVARGLRPLIYKPQDADKKAMDARLRDADAKQQALKFESPDLENIYAQFFGAHSKKAAAPTTNAAAVPTANAAAVPSGGLQVTGSWETLPYLMPINPIHLSMLRTGNLLVTAGTENEPQNFGVSSKAAIWWLQSHNFTEYDNMPWDLFCNGQASLPDGRPFIFGGTEQYDPFEGESRATIFDPAIPSYFPFSEVQSMADGRWYGTATVLGDGRIMAFSGLNKAGNINQTVEIYSLSKTQQGWSTPVSAPFSPPLYPWLFLLPNGNVFYAGGGWGGWAYINGTAIKSAQIFNPSTQTWTASAASYYGYPRTFGSAVLLPLLPSNNYAARVMVIGGEGQQGTGGGATAETIDLSQSNPTWQPSGSMPSGAREEMNAVLFPNGQVLALGGSVINEDATTATLGADLYDPATGTWKAGAAEVYPRLYHNTAVLLPDGCVIVTGSNPQRGVYEQHIEIYTPPWLFDANGNWIPWSARPQITTAPAKIGYGSATFQVQTPNAPGASLPDVVSVVLVKPGSDTHSFDMEQRVVGLKFTRTSGALTVTSPPNSNIAPPGYYMLFLLNSSGVTSIASFLQVTKYPTDTPPKGTITLPATNGADVVIQAGQSVNFAGTASDPDGKVAKYWWFFPDGSPTASTKVSPGPIVFPSTGVYVASLTTVDNVGLNDPSPPTQIIRVQPDRLTATINSPASGATVNGTAVSVTASVTGTTGTSNTFEFVVDTTTKKTVTVSGTNTTFTWNTTQQTNGAHTLKVNVTDANGNFGTQSEPVTVAN